MQCRKRAISALACASRVLQNRTPTAADAPANIASARRRIRDLSDFDQPQVPRVPSTSYSSTSDATIVKLRKEIRDKANDRERKLREAYKRNDFDPTAMNTVS